MGPPIPQVLTYWTRSHVSVVSDGGSEVAKVHQPILFHVLIRFYAPDTCFYAPDTRFYAPDTRFYAQIPFLRSDTRFYAHKPASTLLISTSTLFYLVFIIFKDIFIFFNKITEKIT